MGGAEHHNAILWKEKGSCSGWGVKPKYADIIMKLYEMFSPRWKTNASRENAIHKNMLAKKFFLSYFFFNLLWILVKICVS